MLSLKSVKNIEVKVIDDSVKATIYDEVPVEISNEDSYDEITEQPAPERNEVGITMLLKMFRLHFSRISKRSFDNYLKCWTESFEEAINRNGLTKDEFILCLKQ